MVRSRSIDGGSPAQKPGKRRDYKAEYRKRLERALARGLSRSQARGHARPGEKTLRSAKKVTQPDERLEQALRALRATGNQEQAAKSAHVSPERFRRFIRDNKLAEREGRRWRLTDNRVRELVMITDGRRKRVRVAGFELASLIGQHNAAVKAFLDTNDISKLEPFAGLSVTDVSKRAHPLETRPNILYRLAAAGSEAYEQIYRFLT